MITKGERFDLRRLVDPKEYDKGSECHYNRVFQIVPAAG